MTKRLSKAIMHVSKFKNIYNRKRTNDNWTSYKKPTPQNQKRLFLELKYKGFVG